MSERTAWGESPEHRERRRGHVASNQGKYLLASLLLGGSVSTGIDLPQLLGFVHRSQVKDEQEMICDFKLRQCEFELRICSTEFTGQGRNY